MIERFTSKPLQSFTTSLLQNYFSETAIQWDGLSLRSSPEINMPYTVSVSSHSFSAWTSLIPLYPHYCPILRIPIICSSRTIFNQYKSDRWLYFLSKRILLNGDVKFVPFKNVSEIKIASKLYDVIHRISTENKRPGKWSSWYLHGLEISLIFMQKAHVYRINNYNIQWRWTKSSMLRTFLPT